MTNLKILTVTMLSCLAGIVLGLAVMGLAGRQAAAQGLSGGPAGEASEFQLGANPVEDLAVNATGASVGVGGSFVTEVYERVSPSVVHITNTSYVQTMFWGPQPTMSQASGVIVDPSGYILTNNHVVDKARELTVLMNNGQEYKARLVGQDPGTDLALLKVDCPDALPAAELADSTNVKVGEWVVAIGNPRGLDWTVTVGVISAIGREVSSATGQTIRGLIQTDAAINPGNSGGPLLNADGQVIGINNAIVSSSGGSEGIGLAIPINTGKQVLYELKTHGKVIRPWLGAILIPQNVTPAVARRLNLPVDYGVIIDEVYENSPAFAGGLMPDLRDRQGGYQYDILTQVDGVKISDEQQLLDLVRGHKPGDVLKLSSYRISNGTSKAMELTIQLEEIPESARMTMGYI